MKIPPTEKNLAYAEFLRSQIMLEITLGTFDYAKHFPESSAAGVKQKADRWTVSQGVDIWLKSRVITDTTRNRYRRTVAAHIDGGIGDKPMKDVLRSDLELLKSKLARTLRPKTVNNILIPLRGAFDLAQSDGRIAVNPAVLIVNVMNPRTSDADPFDAAELAALQNALEQPEKNLVEFAWNTGMREGELFGLRWEDIDWQKQTAHVRRALVENKVVETKSKRDRRVKLSDRALEALKRQRAFTELAGGTVFKNPHTGEPYAHAVIFYKRWQAACKRARVRPRPPKQLRHTYASMALSAGEPPLFVMHQLGHGSLTMLERHYAEWMPSANLSAGQGFNRAAGGV